MQDLPEFTHAELPLSSLVDGMREFAGSGKISKDMDFSLKILPSNQALALLAADPDMKKEAETYLGQLGFRKMRFFSSGNFALVFDTTHDQLIKLCIESHNQDGIEADEILKPLLVHTLHGERGNLRMEIFPKLNTQGVTWDHVDAIGISLARKGYVLRHTEPYNIGLLPDGTPMLLDAGSVARTPKTKRHEENFKRWLAMPEPPYDWKGKQEKFFPRIATGELQGVAGDGALAGMEASLGEEGKVYSGRIRSRCQYHGDLLDDLGKAAEAMVRKKQPGGTLASHLEEKPAVQPLQR